MSLILSTCLVLSLCACGGQKTESAAEAPTWQEQYDLGIRYLSEGNYEEAILAFTAAIEIDPKRVEAYISLADTYKAMGDATSAAQVIEDAIAALGELEELIARKGIQRQGDEPGTMTLLMGQSYRWTPDPVTLLEEQGEIVYRYDQYGYLLASEHAQYFRDGHTGEEQLSGTDYCEFFYEDGEMFEHRWWEHSDGRTQDYGTMPVGRAMPGSLQGITNGFTGERGLLMDPYPGKDGEYWNCPARVENDQPNSDTDWAYADVAYDERGYPIAYTSCNSFGEVTGTAELYWETVQVEEE